VDARAPDGNLVGGLRAAKEFKYWAFISYSHADGR
jgi:hypothetical protein